MNIEDMKNLATDFTSHPLSRGISDCEQIGEALFEAAKEIERLRSAQEYAATAGLEVIATRCEWPNWSQYHDKDDPMPQEWDDKPPQEVMQLVALADVEVLLQKKDQEIAAAVEQANARQNASWRLMCEKMVAAENKQFDAGKNNYHDEDIKRLVREAGWAGIYTQWVSATERESMTVPVTPEQVKKFAELVADSERERMNAEKPEDPCIGCSECRWAGPVDSYGKHPCIRHAPIAAHDPGKNFGVYPEAFVSRWPMVRASDKCGDFERK
jgi:hypothetical protein